VHGRVQPQQYAFTLSHYWYRDPVLTTC